MRKWFLVLMALVVLAGSATVISRVKAEPPASPSPTLTVSPAVNAWDKNGRVVVMGSNFPPKQEVSILFYDAFGSLGALENPVKVDDKGNWVAVWPLTDYIKGVLPDGPTSVMAADKDYNILASAPVVFVDTGKDYAKWPAWGQAVFPKPKPKETPKPTVAPTGTPKPTATATATPKP